MGFFDNLGETLQTLAPVAGAAAGAFLAPAGMGVAGAMIGAQLIGGIVANGAASKDRAARDAASKQAIQVLLDAGYPPDISKQLVLKEYKANGIYTPELEQDVEQATTEMSAIKENKQVTDLQLNALKQIAQRAHGGLTPEDRVAMMNLQDQMAQQNQQQQAALQQSLAQRGIAGGGAEIAGALASSQGALQAGAQGARDLMANQSKRALEALAQQGSLSGQIRGQDYDIASAKAQAADAMKRFNIGNQLGVNQRNVASKNQALLQDWINQQNISNKNVDIYNTEQERMNNATMDMYKADLARRGAQSSALGQQARYHGNKADETASGIQGIANVVSNAAGLYDQYQQNQTLNNRLDKLAADKAKERIQGVGLLSAEDDINEYNRQQNLKRWGKP